VVPKDGNATWHAAAVVVGRIVRTNGGRAVRGVRLWDVLAARRGVWLVLRDVSSRSAKERNMSTMILVGDCRKLLATLPAQSVHCVVLDTFGGAGTVELVADQLRRDSILIELNAVYADMAAERIRNAAPLTSSVCVSPPLSGHGR